MTSNVTILTGSSKQRGLAQARAFPQLNQEVRDVVRLRLEGAKEILNRPESKQFIDAQWKFTEKHACDHLEELHGLAEGYDILPHDLFTYLHVSTINSASKDNDGCTIIALSDSSSGPILAKNRDFGASHLNLQQVVLHKDPAHTENECLFVTSLGSPGAYSSGMNKYGLAVVDTHVGYSKPNVGWLRYFLMSEILWQAKTVDDAMEIISSAQHTGGGTLGLVDKSGTIATVELGQSQLEIRRANEGYLSHTNHFIEPKLIPFQGAESEEGYFESSRGRLNKIKRVLSETNGPFEPDNIISLMASHGGNSESICCHGAMGEGHTISSSLYFCADNKLQFCGANPCSDEWEIFEF